MKNITLIGGSGFIGSVLINELGDSDFRISNIDKAASSVFKETIIGDVRDKEALAGQLKPGTDWVVLLAAEHKDNVLPVSLYDEVNVTGTANVLAEMEKKNINRIIFTSSVAVYGLDKDNPDETHPIEPFNPYGKSKWQAEELLREWQRRDPVSRTLLIIRPTVVFGPANRGNVYNLLKQITSGKFMMIGDGKNIKSMAYVENLVGFIKHCLVKDIQGYYVFNYADKPDLSMNELIALVEHSTKRKVSSFRIPYFVGLTGGYFLDLCSKMTKKRFSISAIRVKKFCATTQFSSRYISTIGYTPQFSLEEGLKKTIQSIQSNTTDSAVS